MTLKKSLGQLILLSAMLSTPILAADINAKEDTTPPPAEDILTMEQIPPISNIGKPITATPVAPSTATPQPTVAPLPAPTVEPAAPAPTPTATSQPAPTELPPPNPIPQPKEIVTPSIPLNNR